MTKIRTKNYFHFQYMTKRGQVPYEISLAQSEKALAPSVKQWDLSAPACIGDGNLPLFSFSFTEWFWPWWVSNQNFIPPKFLFFPVL